MRPNLLYCLALIAFCCGLANLALAAPSMWGLCGHPTLSDYQGWNVAFRDRQIAYLQELGCNIYRCSFEYSGGPYPKLIDNIVPAAQAAGITVLPMFPLSLTGSNLATAYSNVYTENYNRAVSWANHAITNGYQLPYWELGNELENTGMVSVQGDGSSPSQYTDFATNGFERIRAALNGAHDGLRDAYADARAAGTTTITPQMLFGATWRHWGLLKKIQSANGSTPVPWDVISWHWYTPKFQKFTAIISDASSSSNGRTPVACLNEFKKKSDPSQPMDIWITEMGRSQHTSKGAVGGSCTAVTDHANSQNWALQAQELELEIDDLVSVSSVKAIIVYEMFDELLNHASSGEAAKAAKGYFGLITGLDGTRKIAFYGYKTKISQYRSTPSPTPSPAMTIEAEAVTQGTASDSATTFYDSLASAGAAEFLAANAVNDYIAYTVPGLQAGTYSVKVRFKKYSSRGQFQLAIDGVNQGLVQDQYGSGPSWVEVDLGDV
jgi:hypothetical protein